MRTHLMAGTALAAATMLVAGGAMAADKKMMKPSISVNGYYEGVVGGLLGDELETKHKYVPVAVGGTDPAALERPDLAMKTDNKKDTSSLDTKTDAEIHFNGRATLDSGMKIHARVELEGQNHHNTDPVDEYFVAVSGSFGQIILGGTGGVPVKMLTGVSGSFATGVGETLNFDLNDWAGTASAAQCGANAGCHGAEFYRIRHIRLDTGDAEKVSYISPKLGGFQVGLTYSPNRMNNDGNGRVDAETGHHDGIEMAAAYTGKFGDVGFAVGAGMTRYAAPNDKSAKDLSDWMVGSRIDFGGGFRAAIAYKAVTDDDKMNQSSIVDGGVRFVQGANSFSVTGSYGEKKETEANHTSLMGSYARALGAGVKAHVNLAWTSSESQMMDGTAHDPTTAANDAALDTTTTAHYQQKNQQSQSAVTLITGIKVVF